jgi:site-specific recombinase XerD
MGEFMNVPADRITFEHFNYDTLSRFFRWLIEDRGCCKATAKQRLSALSSFGDYAQNRNLEAAYVFKNGLNKIAKGSFKKTKHKPRAVFARDEVGILLSMPDTTTELGFRDLVILSIMYASGARVQEICDLTVKNVLFRPDGRTALTITGKGSKTRQVKISLESSSLLKKYIDHKGIGNLPQRHVFSSQTHEHMSISCIEAIFKKYIALAKEKHPLLFPDQNYSPHSMRHSTASHMLEAGIPMAAVKEFLGHASIVSTQVYAELSQQSVDNYLQKWNDRWFSRDTSEIPNLKADDLPGFLA